MLIPDPLETPRYRVFLQNLRDLFRPSNLPPLEVTSQPVAVKDIWGLYGRQKRSFLMSAGLQSAAVILVFTAASSPVVQEKAKQVITLVLPADLAQPELRPKPDLSRGGGGGGDRSPLPASKGRLPKAALRQFVPPVAVVVNEAPKLTMEPSIVAAPDIALPDVNMAQYGDPLAKIGPPSNGPGSGGGIGSGSGGGVGVGAGPGVGAGRGGGVGGGIFRVGGGVSAPRALDTPDPEYSEEARKAKYQGTVVLWLIVDAGGHPQQIKVARSLGMGLDQKAIEAVRKWKFEPAKKDGNPVAVQINVEVNFRLY